MAYELRPDEAVAEAVRRCASEQLNRAIAELREGVHSDPVVAIHTSRKSIKKTRALLRLARSSLPRDQRRADNRTLRDAGQKVAGLRDADVMIQGLDKLSKRFAGRLPRGVFSAVRRRLEADRAAEHDRAAESELVVEALHALDGVARQVKEWQLERDGWGAIGPGLKRTYRDGRAALKRSRRDPSAENLHEWRKRVKDLWYDARLLAPVCGPVMRGHAEEAERLSELLGDDHDLAVLRENLIRIAPGLSVDLEALIGLADHRRHQLQREATLIGRRLYAERPRAFVRRTRWSWKAGRRHARALAATQPMSRRRPKTRSNASSSP